jgi:alcohol dehydrogenase class IV
MRSIEVSWWPNRVISGIGVTARLPSVLRELGARRALIVCGKTISKSDLLTRIKTTLGDACAGVFPEVEHHSPLSAVERAAAAVRTARADAIITVGGGSAIDLGKGIVLIDAAGGNYLDYAIKSRSGNRLERRMLERTQLFHVAIPTTSGSSSEVVPSFGLRDPALGRKVLFWDKKLIPDVALLDPEMTALAPPELAAASGMTAVARCVESLYSVNRNPICASLAVHALRLLADALPKVARDPQDVAARADAQMAASMSGTAGVNSMLSLVHSVGHVVGGKYGLQHGVSHAILLSPAMRLLLPVTGSMQYRILEALGGADRGQGADVAGTEAADRMQALVGKLPLKQRLRDVGVSEDALTGIAEYASHDYMMDFSPRPVAAEEILALLRSVW